MTVRSAADVAALAQLACLLEVSAPKPGNVSPGLPFHDARYEDFLASAVAIGPALAEAGEQPLGTTIRAAIEATRRWTRTNTNLGMVLLLAPLARGARTPGATLRDAVRATLEATSVGDARAVYAAIRVAAPGGLRRVSAQDVSSEPTATLLDTMALAQRHDAIAREYVTGFATTFEVGHATLQRVRQEGLCWQDAIVECYMTLLAAAPDTHIARKVGAERAGRVQRDAQVALAAGGVRSVAGREALAALDRTLRDPTNRMNPGTTADLTAAAIFVTLLEGGWHADA